MMVVGRFKVNVEAFGLLDIKDLPCLWRGGTSLKEDPGTIKDPWTYNHLYRPGSEKD